MALTRVHEDLLKPLVRDYRTEAEALADTRPAAEIIEIHGRLAVGDDQGYRWRGKKVLAAPSTHANWRALGNTGIYDRVYASPHTPASVTELGLIPGQGALVDCTPALNAVILAAKNSNCKSWYFPIGTYDYLTRPNDIDVEGLTFEGNVRSFQTGVHRKRFVSDGTNDAIFNFRKGYFSLKNLEFIGMKEAQLVTGGGTVKTGVGSLVSIISLPGELLGYCNLDNLNFTSDVTADDGGGIPGTGACVNYPLKVSGVASGSTSPGVRHLTLADVVIFGGENGSSFFECTQGMTWNGGGTSRAGGKTGKIHLMGNASTKISYTQISVGPILDGVAFTWAEGGTVMSGDFAAGSITFDANSVGSMTVGQRGNGCIVTNNSAISGAGPNRVCGHHDPDGTIL